MWYDKRLESLFIINLMQNKKAIYLFLIQCKRSPIRLIQGVSAVGFLPFENTSGRLESIDL